MTRTKGTKGTAFGAAADEGRACALAVECARDLSRHASRYDGLFPARPFDPGFFHSLGLVSAFGSPWATAAELRAVSRASLWVFAIDLRIDHAATSRDEVAALAGECLAVAAGAAPGEPVTRFLADLGDDLGGPAAWGEQLGRMLAAMTREWDWREGRARPGLDEYLGNADSVGSSFVNLSHWVATGVTNLDAARTAGDEVQRYLRLLNDLATHARESSAGDVNALILGLDQDQVTARMAELSRSAAELIGPLRESAPRVAHYLDRQVGFNTGFYRRTDYWEAL